MPTITVSGRTTRSFYRNISDGILDGNIPFMPRYSTITDPNIKTEIHKTCMHLLWAISGGEPMQLISNAIPREYKLQIQPLNTVCISIIIIYKR